MIKGKENSSEEMLLIKQNNSVRERERNRERERERERERGRERSIILLFIFLEQVRLIQEKLDSFRDALSKQQKRQ